MPQPQQPPEVSRHLCLHQRHTPAGLLLLYKWGQPPKPPTRSFSLGSWLWACWAGWAGAGRLAQGRAGGMAAGLLPAVSSAKAQPDPCWASIPLCSSLWGWAAVHRARRPCWSYYPRSELLQVLGTALVFSTITVKEVMPRAAEFSIPGSLGKWTLRCVEPELGQPHPLLGPELGPCRGAGSVCQQPALGEWLQPNMSLQARSRSAGQLVVHWLCPRYV